MVNNEPLPGDKKVESLTNGFAPNQDRIGAFWFNEEAVNNFLEQNGLTHMIRSNNVYNKNGYAFHFEDKCLTVFSNSIHNNQLATVFIDDNRIRIVALPLKPIEKSIKIDSTIETLSKTHSKEDSFNI